MRPARSSEVFAKPRLAVEHAERVLAHTQEDVAGLGIAAKEVVLALLGERSIAADRALPEVDT